MVRFTCEGGKLHFPSVKEGRTVGRGGRLAQNQTTAGLTALPPFTFLLSVPPGQTGRSLVLPHLLEEHEL